MSVKNHGKQPITDKLVMRTNYIQRHYNICYSSPAVRLMFTLISQPDGCLIEEKSSMCTNILKVSKKESSA